MESGIGTNAVGLIAAVVTMCMFMMAMLGGAVVQLIKQKDGELAQVPKRRVKAILPVVFPANPLSEGTPLPSEILDYCEEESEDFAREDCKTRARSYFSDSQDWDRTLISLKREDG